MLLNVKRTYEKEELYDSILKRKGCFKRTGSFETGQILLKKTLINTEESSQTRFEKERKIEFFFEKDGYHKGRVLFFVKKCQY